jgi:alanine racemase
MLPSRRSFLGSTAAALAALGLPRGGPEPRGTEPPPSLPPRPPGAGSDPWIEVNPAAIEANAREAARASGGRPVFATVKNNGYGLGLEEVGRVLDGVPEVVGLAVVKVDEAHRLADAEVRKPILLMAHPTDAEAEELVARGVHLAPFHDGDPARIRQLGRRLQRPVSVHLYVDTGMSRMGIPHHRALPWIREMAALPEARIESTFTGLTQDHDFDREQVRRLSDLASAAADAGVGTGPLHAASSDAIVHVPETFLDLVRPGIMLFGAHSDASRGAGRVHLEPALRLRAPVVRVERLRPGDTVSYGRTWTATEPTWVATLPVGHTDGYPRQATQGVRILVGGRTFPVIGFVSASHCIVHVGAERTVAPGDIATLIGPDHPDVHPNEVAERAGRSVYDVLMHLTPSLPKHAWG